MNVDQMITNIACSGLSDEYAYPIMAALRAAQGMREDLEYAGRYSFHAETWDAAIKEEDV